MKFYKKFFTYSFIVTVLALLFVACDKDFTTLDSDIINSDTATNFNTLSQQYDVISYSDTLAAVQTNGLAVNMLGIYNNPTYGQTVASIVTQVSAQTFEPTFGDEVELDSVVLSLPYFNRNVGLSEENTALYELDSVFSAEENISPFKLSIFENTYFLRNFDPNEDFDTSQSYFSNRFLSGTEQISSADLENTLIATDTITVSENEVVLKTIEDTDTTTTRLTPRIRSVWRNNVPNDASVLDYWKTKIIEQETQATLNSANNFNDYFRGIF